MLSHNLFLAASWNYFTLVNKFLLEQDKTQTRHSLTDGENVEVAQKAFGCLWGWLFYITWHNIFHYGGVCIPGVVLASSSPSPAQHCLLWQMCSESRAGVVAAHLCIPLIAGWLDLTQPPLLSLCLPRSNSFCSYWISLESYFHIASITAPLDLDSLST